MNKTTGNLPINRGEMHGMVGVIQLFVPGNPPREFSLGAKPLVIGRSPECDIVLSDGAISRRHAKIVVHNGNVVVKDLGSAHGVLVHNVAVQEQELHTQDEFFVGNNRLKFLGAADYKMKQISQGDDQIKMVSPPAAENVQPLTLATTAQPGVYGSYGAQRSLANGSQLLDDLIGATRDQWRLVVAVIGGAVLAGLLHGSLAIPIFETNAVVQVEPRARVIGGPFSDFENSRGVNDGVADEFEVVQSRSVLGEVVDNLDLSIRARPTYFPEFGEMLGLPKIGAAIARARGGTGETAEPLFGLKKYAWSDESITVESMEIPDAFLGENFEIVAGPGGTFMVMDADENVLARGKVGETLPNWLPTQDASALLVSRVNAHAGAVFRLSKIPRLSTIERLRELLVVTRVGPESSIAELSYTGANPERIAEILNEVVKVYAQQNVRRQSEDATSTLQFIEEQIPIAKEKMENAEKQLNNLRMQRGSVDLPRDMEVVLDRIVRLESDVSNLVMMRAELIQRFMPQHPRIQSLDSQIRNLNQDLAATESRIQELPTTERQILSNSRDVTVATELYLSLVNRVEELKVVREYAATTGNIRVVDYASIPLKPFRPNPSFLLLLYMMLGSLIGVGLALFHRKARNIVYDPEIIENQLGLPVYAILPHSGRQDDLRKHAAEFQVPILAQSDPTDSAIEGMRSLRTSLQFAFVNAKNNVLLITGPTAGIGKTFVVSNLAAVLAASGHSVVVVDGDLRGGKLHKQFNLSREPGLVDAIAGDVELEKLIHQTDIDGLCVVSSGATPPNPSELLMHKHFMDQLEDLATRFDYVIIDSPPVNSFTDSVLLSRLAGVVLLVAKSGVHTMRDIEKSVKLLVAVNANLRGVVFNDMPRKLESNYGYGTYPKGGNYAGANG